jgi:serine/threonine-protein kinase
MGVVFEATHMRLQQTYALKFIRPDLADDERMGEEARNRFQREAEISAKLAHPNIVRTVYLGEWQGALYAVSDFVDGRDLKSVVDERGRLDASRAAEVIGDIAEGLDAAHANGVVHRDVKPANVMLQRGEARERAVLTDFGLARLVSSTTELTATGHFLGTLPFAAPEQLQGGDVDHRADVYSLGCVLYYVLVGEVVFPRPSRAAMVAAALNDDPPQLSSRVPSLPTGFDQVIARALSKDPKERFASAGDLAQATQAALAGEVAAGDPASARIPYHDLDVEIDDTSVSFEYGGVAISPESLWTMTCSQSSSTFASRARPTNMARVCVRSS